VSDAADRRIAELEHELMLRDQRISRYEVTSNTRLAETRSLEQRIAELEAKLVQRDVYEAEQRLGGHTHTHAIELPGERQQVDTGFIVFNPDHYPLLTRLFGELGVESQPTIMSFAVKNEMTGLEYNATNVERLFCQRRNLLRPTFWRMVREILRFYREAPALLADPDLAGLDLTVRIAHGHPNPVLFDLANEMGAELIVVGKHGGSRLEESVMGSITRLLAYYAPGDVLIV